MTLSYWQQRSRTVNENSYVDVLSLFQHLNHIVPIEHYRKDQAALCGSDGWVSRSQLHGIKSEYLLEFGDEIEAENYCKTCFLVFTGVITIEDPAIIEELSNHYKDEGRWCQRCNRFGSHKTDRHEVFLNNMRITQQEASLV